MARLGREELHGKDSEERKGKYSEVKTARKGWRG